MKWDLGDTAPSSLVQQLFPSWHVCLCVDRGRPEVDDCRGVLRRWEPQAALAGGQLPWCWDAWGSLGSGAVDPGRALWRG